MKLAELMLRKRELGEKAFVAFVTAGDPDIFATEEIVKSLVASGVDVIELGVPFSDPVADGPTNQRAAERALSSHTSLRDILRLVKKLRDSGESVPIVLFTYYNPLFRMGLDVFADSAKESGVDAVLTVDLPPEEAQDYVAALSKRGVGTVFLVAPTTEKSRLPAIDSASTAFVYYVSRTGVTGERQSLSDTLATELSTVRALIKKPIMVGFGISTPEQAAQVAKLGDGVVVGSAIVKVIEETSHLSDLRPRLTKLVSGLVRATKGT